MYRKIISLFLALQIASFGLWYGVKALENQTAPEPVFVSKDDALNHEAAKTAEAPKQPFSHMSFAARNEERQYSLLNSEKKKEIASVLAKLPPEHLSTLKNLVLDYNPKAHRGLGGKSLIILRAVDMDETEFYGVLIHEIGHSVDLGHLNETEKKKISEFDDGKKPVYETDPSLDFYRISWTDEKTRKRDVSNMDFVSGYALSDPFEDFAECYVYYVLHNKEFKSKTQTSAKLLQKYNFFKEKVFDGKEFDTGTYLTEGLKSRPWDITVLSYDLNNFLNS